MWVQQYFFFFKWMSQVYVNNNECFIILIGIFSIKELKIFLNLQNLVYSQPTTN
jgi:hypothetical protein